MSCHTCKVTGIRTCDPEEAEIKCMICGFRECQATQKAMRDEAAEDGDSDE